MIWTLFVIYICLLSDMLVVVLSVAKNFIDDDEITIKSHIPFIDGVENIVEYLLNMAIIFIVMTMAGGFWVIVLPVTLFIGGLFALRKIKRFQKDINILKNKND